VTCFRSRSRTVGAGGVPTGAAPVAGAAVAAGSPGAALASLPAAVPHSRQNLAAGGSARWTSYRDMMEKHPDRVITHAVRGMLPKTKLGRAVIKKLKVYPGAEHPHGAQQPEVWAPPAG
jgi:hypothetical protein